MPRILIVEDSRMQAREFAMILEDAGYECEVVHDAESGLERVSSERFDVVLSDVYLPGSTGIELCARIKSQEALSALPVIMITNWADPVNVLRSLEAGAEGVIVKNGDSADLINRVRQVLSRAATKSEARPPEVTRVHFNGQEYVLATGREELLDVLLTIFQGVYECAQRCRQEVAERRQAEEALQASRNELERRVEERTASLREYAVKLERTNRELEDFAYIASHDLQEPLRKIQAFGTRVEAALRDYPNRDVTDSIGRMLAACSRLRKLINDLLSYSHVTTRGKPFEEVDLHDLAQDVVCDLEVALNESKGQVEIGSLPPVEADPVQMRQLLQNLIGNALKFRKPDVPPHVRISARVIDDSDGTAPGDKDSTPRCELIVEDNGIGFDPKYSEKIFAAFQRLHGRGEYEGTGIGLAICRKIVERHRGAIRAESRLGYGSRFTVTLPTCQSRQPQLASC